MSEKILFVGGPRDGKREHLPPDTGTAVLGYSHGPRCSVPDVADRMSGGITTWTYTLKKLRTESGVITVAFDSSITDPMAALVKGYRYHRNPRRRYG